MRHLILLLVLGLVCATHSALAQSFTAQANPPVVSQGNRLEITFVFTGEGTNFRAPDFSALKVLSGPNTSQSMQIINGNVRRSISYSYVLLAERKGKFNIEPATIKSGNEIFKSNPITVEVVEPSQAEKMQREAQKEQEQSVNSQAQDIISKNLFIKTSVSKSKVYKGEQLTATYKIYMHPELQVNSLNPTKNPSFVGFWTQDVEGGELKWEYETLDGVRFRAATIKKVVLIPQQSGSLKIDPMEFETAVRLRVGGSNRRSRDPFDDFFGGGANYQNFNYKLSSTSIAVESMKLPEGAPVGYNGAVGKFEMNAFFDKTETVTGEPVALKVKISGTGNLKLIEAPELSFPSDFESYEPKTADNTNVKITGTTGNKIFEYLLIPRNPGKFKIDPIQFSYFDPQQAKYISLSSSEFLITVGKGSGSTASTGGSVSGISKEAIQYLGKDIRYIKTKLNTDNYDRSSSGLNNYFWLFYLSSFASFFLFLILFKKKKELDGNQVYIKNRQAVKLAKKRLSVSKKLLNSGDKDKFYQETARALWGYISDKLAIPGSQLTKDNTKLEMERLEIDDKLIEDFLGTLDECEYARFAPDSGTGMMEKVYDDATKVIVALEAKFK